MDYNNNEQNEGHFRQARILQWYEKYQLLKRPFKNATLDFTL